MRAPPLTRVPAATSCWGSRRCTLSTSNATRKYWSSRSRHQRNRPGAPRAESSRRIVGGVDECTMTCPTLPGCGCCGGNDSRGVVTKVARTRRLWSKFPAWSRRAGQSPAVQSRGRSSSCGASTPPSRALPVSWARRGRRSGVRSSPNWSASPPTRHGSRMSPPAASTNTCGIT